MTDLFGNSKITYLRKRNLRIMDRRKLFLYLGTVLLIALTATFVLFAFNLPRCYPKKMMKLSSTDMRLASPESTFWCEALELSSEHPFLAFQLSEEPEISQKSILSRNEVYLNLDLEISETRHVQYFLLRGTTVTAVMCATHPGTTIYVMRETDIKEKHTQLTTASNCDQNSDGNPSHYPSEDENPITSVSASKAVKVQDIPARNIDDTDCLFSSKSQLLQFNVTSTDVYFLVVHYKGPTLSNLVKIRLFLDRTSYDITKQVKNVRVCTGGSFRSSCEIPLNFLSSNRVLVKIPGEPEAGLTAFKVQSSCKPRFVVYSFFRSILRPISVLALLALVMYSVVVITLYLRHRCLATYFKLRSSSVSTLQPPLLASSEDEGGDNSEVEEIVVTQTTKPGDSAINEDHKEVKVLVEFPEDSQHTTNDPPPPYQTLVFNPEVDQ